MRAGDLPPYYRLDLPDVLMSKLNAPQPQGATEGGCADASLYARMEAHFGGVLANPFWVIEQPPQPGRIDSARDALLPDGVNAFDAALQRGVEDGSAFVAWPQHCAVGIGA